jgi:hypothetical protein
MTERPDICCALILHKIQWVDAFIVKVVFGVEVALHICANIGHCNIRIKGSANKHSFFNMFEIALN